ncbi:hypothetical protein CGGC5_v017106 [Colletotrichum fructicola Nara gc5]|uniref:Uncharacterized protein n=1 Tax=Colletotrichum fructicola (strain Nara gc5) TaxID=1213859 RepID=A0A7J6IF90_COLFN|nr:hypothetical protein CGGC5_v017106 [Colletotrichum fructicola Nara gc5]
MASQTTGTGPGKKPWYGGEPCNSNISNNNISNGNISNSNIIKDFLRTYVVCWMKAINDDGFMRDFGARIAGPKRKGGLLDKQGRTTHTTPDLDSLEKLKAVEEMIERQSGQAKSMLKAMENRSV